LKAEDLQSAADKVPAFFAEVLALEWLQMVEALADDLNTPRALAVLHEFANQLYDVTKGKRIYLLNPASKPQSYGALDEFKFRRTPSKTAEGYSV
jgi:cysteinyl-tRNA synthetase